MLLLLQGKKELEVKIAFLDNLRLYCKQQGQRSSSHPFRPDLVLHCTTWLVPGTALNPCIDRSFLHLTVGSNLSLTICCTRSRNRAGRQPSKRLDSVHRQQHGSPGQNTRWCWNIPWDGHSEHWMGLEHSLGWAFKTLDGAVTFRGMGIIGAATPGTKHRKAIRREVTATLETVMHHGQSLYMLLWCFRRRSVIGLRGVLQNFTAEDKSKILYIPWKISSPLSRLVSDDAECVRQNTSWSEYLPFLPMIDIDPTNMSCIFLHSSLALRYGATPVLIFDQPCGGKPRRSLTMSHLTVSHGLSSYGLGDFTQKWAFLAARDDWRQDRAFNNCCKWSLLRIFSQTCWLTRPSPEQFEDIFLLHAVLNAEL